MEGKLRIYKRIVTELILVKWINSGFVRISIKGIKELISPVLGNLSELNFLSHIPEEKGIFKCSPFGL
jgi:hypothetical protein